MEKLHYIGLLFLNFTVLNLILSLTFFVISYGLKKTVSSIYIRSSVFFISIMAPPVVSSFILVSSFIPPVFIKPHNSPMPCLNEPYCYIFSFLPEFPMFRAALIAAVILVLLSALYSIVSLFGYFRLRRQIDGLADLSGTELNSVPIGLISGGRLIQHIKVIETPLTFSFVWGYLSEMIVISTGALKTLSPDELKCLFAHEASHYRRRDNILKGMLSLCRNTLIAFPHVHLLCRWWKEEIELIGDDAAVLSTGKPTDVASAILKMQGTSATGLNRSVWRFATGFTASASAKPLTRRIERLIELNDSISADGKVRHPLIPSEVSILAGLTLMFPLLFVMIYEIDPLMIHCYLEKLTSVF